MGDKAKSNYGFEDICFGNVSTRTVRGSNTEYKTMNLRRSDGGKVIIKTPILVCQGLKKEISFGNTRTAYKLLLKMNSFGTQQEKEFLDSFHGIVEKCKKHLISVKGELGHDELTKRDLTGLASCLYLGKKEKTIVDGKVATVYTQKDDPTLFAKVRIWDGKFESTFSMHEDLKVGRYNKPGKRVHQLSLLNKKCLARTYLILDNIYIGSNRVYSLQVKLKEAICQPYVEERLDEAPIEEGDAEFTVDNQPSVLTKLSTLSLDEEEGGGGGEGGEETDECESDF